MAENYCDCGNEGIVGIGVGGEIKYVCMDHFSEWLQGVRETFDRRLSNEQEEKHDNKRRRIR